MDHDGIYGHIWDEKQKHGCLILKIEVLSTAFCYARYSKGTEELTNFGMENSISLPALAKKFFNSLRDETDETIYTFNNEVMRYLNLKN